MEIGTGLGFLTHELAFRAKEVITIIPKELSTPKKTKNFTIYFRRWLYNHEDWKVKNTLREEIVKAAYDLKGIIITKNEAKKLKLDT